MENYEELLKRGTKQLPQVTQEVSRFEVPKVMGHIQGNKTIISNITQIADTIRRPVEHLVKFLLKELATPGELRKNFLILGTKMSASRINEKIQEYTNRYVICPECKKPDTKLKKESGFMFILCQACGAKKTVKE